MFCEERTEFVCMYVCVCVYMYVCIYIYIYNVVYSLQSFNPSGVTSGLYQAQRECYTLEPASRENNVFLRPYK